MNVYSIKLIFNHTYYCCVCLFVQFISWRRIIAIIVASISLLLLIAMEAATTNATTNLRYLHVISNYNDNIIHIFDFYYALTVNYEETFSVEISLFFYYNI